MTEPTQGLNERLIHVCVNVDCALRGSEELYEKLEALIDSWEADVDVAEWLCFGACRFGPNMLVEHKRTFCSGVTPEDLESIVRHALDDEPLPPHIDRSGSFIARKMMNLLDAGLRPGELATRK